MTRRVGGGFGSSNRGISQCGSCPSTTQTLAGPLCLRTKTHPVGRAAGCDLRVGHPGRGPHKRLLRRIASTNSYLPVQNAILMKEVT